MKIIADSGSTKTDWALVDGHVNAVTTQGINPVLMTASDIERILQDELFPQLTDMVPNRKQAQCIEFYGAGVTGEHAQKLHQVLKQAFPKTDGQHIGVYSDLLGAARALCGHSEGIASILGTGSNSCLFDGEKIIRNTPALGYILGDEGGGAAMGKRFLNALFKGILPAELRDEYMAETHLSLADIIQKVYREPMPNRFLASTSTFIHSHLHYPALRQMVVENFRQFVVRNILPYGRGDLGLGAVGSIAFYYEDLLREATEAEGIRLTTVVKSPLLALVDYHCGPLSMNQPYPHFK